MACVRRTAPTHSCACGATSRRRAHQWQQSDLRRGASSNVGVHASAAIALSPSAALVSCAAAMMPARPPSCAPRNSRRKNFASISQPNLHFAMSVETMLRDLEAKRVTLERMEREAHQHDGTLERLSQELMASRQAVAQVQVSNPPKQHRQQQRQLFGSHAPLAVAPG